PMMPNITRPLAFALADPVPKARAAAPKPADFRNVLRPLVVIDRSPRVRKKKVMTGIFPGPCKETKRNVEMTARKWCSEETILQFSLPYVDALPSRNLIPDVSSRPASAGRCARNGRGAKRASRRAILDGNRLFGRSS